MNETIFRGGRPVVGFGDDTTPPTAAARNAEVALFGVGGAVVGGLLGHAVGKGTGAAIGAVAGGSLAGGVAYVVLTGTPPTGQPPSMQPPAPAAVTPALPTIPNIPIPPIPALPTVPVTPSAPAPSGGSWRLLQPTDSITAGQQLAIAFAPAAGAPALSADQIAALQMAVAQSGATQLISVYPPGTSPPPNWPSDDTLGSNVLRAFVQALISAPNPTSMVPPNLGTAQIWVQA